MNSFIFNLIKIHWLLDNDIKIGKIGFSLDDHMLYRKSNNRNRSLIYSDMSRHQEVYNIPKSKFLFYRLSRYIPIIYPSNQKIFKKQFESILLNQREDDQKTNWEQLPDSIRINRAESRMKTFYSSKNERIFELNRKNLVRILSLAQENNIEVIGIKFPLSKEMLHLIDSMGMTNKVLYEAQNLGMNKYIIFENTFNEPELLSDQDHVNANGADSLSLELIRVFKGETDNIAL